MRAPFYNAQVKKENMTLLTEALICMHITHATEFKHRPAGENSPIYEIYPNQYISDPKILEVVKKYFLFSEEKEQFAYLIVFDNHEPDYAMVALMDNKDCISKFGPIPRKFLK